MKRRIAIVLTMILVLTACGESETTGTPDEISGSIHVSGGIAGVDVTWTLAADGTVTSTDGATGTVRSMDLTAIREAIATARFFELTGSYMPEDTCCDRFTYELTLTQGNRTNTVVTIDAAEAPQSLFALIDLFRSAMWNAVTVP